MFGQKSIAGMKKIWKYYKTGKLTWANIKNFIQGTWRASEYISYTPIDYDNSTLNAQNDHTLEQVIWRISQVSEKSPNCLNGICYCGCDTPDLFFCDSVCNEGKGTCYGPMKTKEEWEEFKAANNISIPAIYTAHEEYISKNIIKKENE